MEIERFVEEAQREAQQRRLVSAHPAEEALWAYVGGHLPERARWRIGAHLGSCLSCAGKAEAFRKQLAELDPLLQARLPVPPVIASRPWWERLGVPILKGELEKLLRPRRLAQHALAYALGSLALFGLNLLLNELFAPPPSPLSSPAPPPTWWPYVVGVWGGVVGVHLLLVLWARRRR
jgi:hypothetical protein